MEHPAVAVVDLLATTEPVDDIVRDILQRVVARLGDVPANIPLEVEAEIRRDWGGDRPYIAKAGEAGKVQRSQRETAIRAEHQRGVHVNALARKWGIGIRQVQRILKS